MPREMPADMSALPEFLPWQRDIASAWLSHRERFSHAWLIHGMPGIGKQHFALAAAASLLCEAPAAGLACGACQACQWVLTGNHPDIRRIRPDALAAEEAMTDASVESDASTTKKSVSKEIRVDQLRELNSWFNTATHRGGWRVAVLYPAQALNVISANALLKVLEEPPPHTIFLLVADAPDRLLPTLLSRCRRLPLPVPPRQDSLEWLVRHDVKEPEAWLSAASNAPLKALRMAESGAQACPDWLSDILSMAARGDSNPDVGSLADKLEKEPPELWIDILQRLFVDLSLLHAGQGALYYPSLQPAPAVARGASMQNLSACSKWLAEQRAISGHPLNAKLFVHTILQRVIQACRPVSVASR